MAQQLSTSAGTQDPGPAADLSPEEQKQILDSDKADTTVKADAPKLSGKRVRAIPATITRNGDVGTTVEVRREDFKQHGVDHPTVKFDRFKSNYTLAIGGGDAQISAEAAELLTKNWPTSFEYIDG